MLNLYYFLFSLMFFTCLGFLFFQNLFKHKNSIDRRVKHLIKAEQTIIYPESIGKEQAHSAKDRLLKPIFFKIRSFTIKSAPNQKLTRIEKKLQAAGYPFKLSAGDFIVIQTFLPILFFLLFVFIFMPLTEEKIKVLFLAGIVAGFVYSYTNYYLIVKQRQRIKKINRSMPDFFDMLNVSIEAGMGLDGALKRVCSQMDSPLSYEFLSALEDMKLGKTRKQAFIELRERVPSDFFRSVISSIIQADQMGIGMSKVLTSQTKRIRERQKFSAKEQAMKAPVKMLIPMVLFIFPTLFIVLIGPILIKFITQFL